MASLHTDANGLRRISFRDANGIQKTIRLSRMPKKSANTFKDHVEKLVWAQISKDTPEPETARWLNRLDATLLKKLETAGLTLKQKQNESTVAEWIDRYIASRKDAKSATLLVYGHVRRNLSEFFGPKKLLRDVTEGDADEFRLHLRSVEKLSENTIRRRCGFAKQFFRAAVRKRLIDRNPFADLSGQVTGNESRQFFLSPGDAEKILAACPDSQWRLIFALSRFGGLRCPSEHLALRWSDIDWERSRMTVRSPKTEHHQGKASRLVPIFPELRPHLDALWADSPDGSDFIITRYRDATQNLRTTFLKIIQRAGLLPWPKLFHNLRATRQTELAAEYPLHVVCAWLGNSRLVAAEHYLQVTDDDFTRASEKMTTPVTTQGAKPSETEESEKQETPENAVVSGVSKADEWTWQDSNLRPQRCQRCDLTN